MSGEVVNLRLARKRKARTAASDAAAQNRVRHGLTKAERERQKAQAQLDASRLDGHERT